MNIEGNKVIVNKSAEDVFTYFDDLQNFKTIMPDNIQKFEVEGDSFLFGLPGMPEIRLVLKEKTPFTNITLGAASSKMPFTLSSDIKELVDDKCEIQLNFEGEFNPMMAMMIKKPITKFVDALTENLRKL
ncbi:SRPBCC family protein [Polaribacter sp. WD7]|uniref:SRPBCC family protein n=1 Tax=Polaribacter sp. WD7 TaxID=2269061 RepID=UPI000DF45731|nr:SRPBCC family protein [Polaribacter sp. WD7]RCS27566.1 SRPBCC family protein [Polaribacter sp. WD7]